MEIDFSKYVKRKGSNSVKWDMLSETFGKEDLLPMWVADSDWPTSPSIIKAIKKRADHGIFGYTFPDQKLKNIIVNWIKKHYDWNIKKEWIVFSNGVVPSLNIAVQTFTNNGDEVIIQPPVYYPFRSAVENNGAIVVNNQLKNTNGKYKFDLKELKNILKDSPQKLSRAKLLILCSPHNPVGRVWEKEELAELGKICLENDVKILSDEIHADFVYEDNKHTPIASLNNELGQNTLTFMAPSKTFNIAGLNSSFVIIENEKLRKEFMVNKNGLVGTGNIFGLVAMKAAYQNGEKWLSEQLSYLNENMKFAVNYINENIPGITARKSEGTYLLWLDCKGLNLSDSQLEDFFINEANLALDPGLWFGQGGSGYMRMNLACPRSTLKKGLENLKKAVRGDQ